MTTNKGTVKIEVDDPDVVVRIDGDDVITIDESGKPIMLRVGEHQLVVKRGDLEVETRKFTVRRGENPTLRVELQPKEKTEVAEETPPSTMPPENVDEPDSTASLSGRRGTRRQDGSRALGVRALGLATNPGVRNTSGRRGRSRTGQVDPDVTSKADSSAAPLATTGTEQPDGPGEVLVLRGHTSAVSRVAFSPDGKRVISGGFGDQSVRIWEIETGLEVHRFEPNAGGTLRRVVFA